MDDTWGAGVTGLMMNRASLQQALRRRTSVRVPDSTAQH
jgi:hypothetical protein